MLKISSLKRIHEEIINICGFLFGFFFASKDKEDIIFIALPVGGSMLFLLGLWITCILKKHA